MSVATSLQWTLRKGMWNVITRLKYRKAIPKNVTNVTQARFPVKLIPLGEVYPSIPIADIRLAQRPPKDEAQWGQEKLMRGVAWLCTKVSPMQLGLPPVSANPYEALEKAYTKRHRQIVQKQVAAQKLDPARALRPPTMPAELHECPDLGTLAVRGPYAGYLRRVSGSEEYFEWNLEELHSYGHHSNLYAAWARVLFKIHPAEHSMRAVQIRCELGTVRPADTTWALAVRIAICAATTHTALVRHWTWTHLIGGEYFAAATRNCLPAAHPLCRLLWPHIVGTHASNRLAILGQLVPEGDFEHIYGLTYAEMCRFASKTRHDFNLRVCDPEEDARYRGILDVPVRMDTVANCRDIFQIFLRHAERYLQVYYTDDGLRRDSAVCKWLGELDRLLENGIGLGPEPLTCHAVARVIARLIYLVTVHHEQVGTHSWNYQLWPHANPVRVYQDGRRMPEDVYQRLVNSNYILNVVRAPLVQDYADLVLPDTDHPGRRQRAQDVWRKFNDELETLQRSMEREPWACWKLYPADLEANINA